MPAPVTRIVFPDPRPWGDGTPVTRFAPSPTGHLHLGHVLSLIFVWGVGRRAGARIVLRMEDHDRVRARQPYEAAILDEMAWLGFRADAGVTDAAQPSPWRQSDHPERYEDALRRLDAAGLVYACACSRSRLAALPAAATAGELVYDGHCRDLGLPWEGHGLRVRLPPGERVTRDAWLGTLRQDPAAQCGDMLIRDRLGQWTYQFAVVVDDVAESIDLVIRGQDLTPSVGRQLALREALGATAPVQFLHHPLIKDPQGEKLSKRQRSESVTLLREAGATSAAVIGHAAWLGGLIPDKTPIRAEDVPALFEVT